MTLESPEGGKVSIRLDVHGESVHAQIVAPDESARASLSAGHDDLREHLRQQSLALAQLDVSTGGSSGSGSDQRHARWLSVFDDAPRSGTPAAHTPPPTARLVLSNDSNEGDGAGQVTSLDVRA